jgi:hypothetical protein
MVSVIICSKNPDLLEIAIKSIKKTIGVEHEFIIFDNSKENIGICEVYNLCAKKSIYKYLCFVHEDVFFESNKWASILIEKISSHGNIGIIGVAGTGYVPRNFISWGDNEKFDRCNYWQYSNKKEIYEKYNKNPINEIFSEVLILDGVFLFLEKYIWQKIHFDENNFKGFHLYDSDFTFNVSLEYKNYVYTGLDIYHKSSGNSNSKEYCDSLIKFQKKWKKHAPRSVCNIKNISPIYKLKKEYYNSFELLKRYQNNYRFRTSLYYVICNSSLLIATTFILGLLFNSIKFYLKFFSNDRP